MDDRYRFIPNEDKQNYPPLKNKNIDCKVWTRDSTNPNLIRVSKVLGQPKGKSDLKTLGNSLIKKFNFPTLPGA